MFLARSGVKDAGESKASGSRSESPHLACDQENDGKSLVPSLYKPEQQVTRTAGREVPASHPRINPTLLGLLQQKCFPTAASIRVRPSCSSFQ